MSLSIAFAALLGGTVVWWLLVSRLTAKPWQTQGSRGAAKEGGPTRLAPARIGLWTFLGVITSLFGLFITAYRMRMMDGMQHGDWSHFPVPRLLWLNSVLLVLASVAMQWARAAAARGRLDRLAGRLVTAGLLTVAFLAGQLLAWRQVSATGYFSGRNPAIDFFYLLTAVHGLHLLGGLVVWAKTVRRLSAPDTELQDLSVSVELCTIYWHYLLIVWLVLFGLLLST